MLGSFPVVGHLGKLEMFFSLTPLANLAANRYPKMCVGKQKTIQ